MKANLPLCMGNTVPMFNVMTKDWVCALPNSTLHYLADRDRWILCPDEWILTTHPTTGAFQWVPPRR